MTNDKNLHTQITDLIAQEKELRDQVSNGEISPDDERSQLSDIEVQLDQCWDLLRQRDALRRAGKDPDDAEVRPPNVVEGYLN
ncbi:DUF2630 family protein [Williamsia sp. D3]|uniref:DUF2630 family protein n=1 Tax=Williamsia sp. D3 TaxID=1313067 RepID=UPI0003D3654C|nr:DUF2630 family protein [Williamsia sp. D3]ETD30266.1 hypothetical protein W823_24715 [Williamsia sp. D3]